MKKLALLFLAGLVAAGTVSVGAGTAHAQTTEDWLDKEMGFGIGAGRTIGSGAGLSLRMFPVSPFGLELVFGGSSMKRSTQAGPQPGATSLPPEIIIGESQIAASLLADFRFLRSHRTALSGFVGFGIVRNSVRGTLVQQVAPVPVTQKITDSFTDFLIQFGLRGEIFLYKFFSVNGRVGITIDPYTESEATYAGTPGNIPDPTQPQQPNTTDFGGVDISIFDGADLFGSFGFTLWFN